MTQEQIATAVSELVYTQYEKLKPTNKPRIKSNGTKECTVLSSIVAIDKLQSTTSLEILALTTGVKATPDIELCRSKGKMVHDCHAEVLAIRAFNAILLDEMIQLKNDKTSRYLLKIGDKYKWNAKWSLVLFISRLPCGDASMDSIDSTTDEDKLINMTDNDPYQYVSPKHKKTLRGRFNFNKKGYVRTKPGRYDSKITLSKSCSDKICLRQVISLNNSFTYSLMADPIYLDYLIIPHIDSTSKISLKRCFEERVRESSYPIHPFQILSTNQSFKDDIVEGKEPSPISVVKLFRASDKNVLEQAILNGVKNGSYTKGKKPLRKNCESIVSRYAFWKKYNQLNPLGNDSNNQIRTYDNFKRKYNKNRDEMIISVKKLLVKGEDWVTTYNDDFDLI
ncbi:tRNA-specific adenosine deaminase 1 [Monosporozyma unispora]